MKLIFVDIDGTLTLPGAVVPPDSAVDAIRKARQNGHRVFLCSGRNPSMLSPLLAYGFDGAVASAGGHITVGDRVIFDKYIEPGRLNDIINIFHENGVSIAIEALESVYGDKKFADAFNISLESKREKLGADKVSDKIRILPMEQYGRDHAYKLIYICDDEKQLDEPMRLLGDEFHFCRQSLHVKSRVNGELINRAFDKGRSVEMVCSYLGIPLEDTIGFGDSNNDMELIIKAGTGVCMANGCDELKAVSDLICPAVDEDGLAWAFEYLGLI